MYKNEKFYILKTMLRVIKKIFKLTEFNNSFFFNYLKFKLKYYYLNLKKYIFHILASKKLHFVIKHYFINKKYYLHLHYYINSV